MKISKFLFLSLALCSASLSGCAAQHAAAVRDSTEGATVGLVQREIRVGMSGAEVARVLGSPNIVTTDEQRLETWVYDKISTDTVRSSSSTGGIGLLVLGAHASGGASSTSQRTLTVIIKFDQNGAVRDFAYHTSRF